MKGFLEGIILLRHWYNLTQIIINTKITLGTMLLKYEA